MTQKKTFPGKPIFSKKKKTPQRKNYGLWISKCCNAEATVEIKPDFIGDDPETMEVGTCSFLCSKCGKPCDVIENFGKRQQNVVK